MDNKLRSSRKILITVLICLIVAAVLICGVVYLMSKLSDYGSSAAITAEETPEEEEIIEQETVETVPENRYSTEGFYEIKGIKYYYHSGYEGIPGVDVSSYQSTIDWSAVKDAGVEFAMIRVGYRGWTTGVLDEDDRFKEHIEGALAAGLDVGVYFFSQALTVEEAVEEANFTVDLIKDYDITYPVIFDWEEVAAENARTNEMNMRLLTSCADAFCRTVEDAGYRGGIYFNQAYGYEQINLLSLKDYEFWLAEYAEYPTFAYDFQMWQYTDKGSVPGIDGNVDLNILFRKK